MTFDPMNQPPPPSTTFGTPSPTTPEPSVGAELDAAVLRKRVDRLNLSHGPWKDYKGKCLCGRNLSECDKATLLDAVSSLLAALTEEREAHQRTRRDRRRNADIVRSTRSNLATAEAALEARNREVGELRPVVDAFRDWRNAWANVEDEPDELLDELLDAAFLALVACDRRPGPADTTDPEGGRMSDELEQWQCIVVEWIDSCGSGGWHQVEDHHTRAIHCVTCGLLYSQNEDALTVVLSRDLDNGNVSGLITIPKLAITALHKAKEDDGG